MSHLTIQLFTIWFQHTEKSTNVSNVWQPQRPHLATFKVLLPLVVFSAWWVCGDFARFWIVLTSWVEIGWHFLLVATANCETVCWECLFIGRHKCILVLPCILVLVLCDNLFTFLSCANCLGVLWVQPGWGALHHISYLSFIYTGKNSHCKLLRQQKLKTNHSNAILKACFSS